MNIRYLQIGFLYLIIPLILFVNPNNIAHLSKVDLSLIVLFHLIITAIISFSIIAFLKYKNISSEFFIIICFGFYYSYFYKFIENFLMYNEIIEENFYIITNLILLIFYVFIFYIFKLIKFIRLIFIRSSIIFFFLIIAYTLYQYSKYYQNNDLSLNTSKNENNEIDLFIENNFKNNINSNIYYIIPDEMLDLNLATRLELVKEQELTSEFFGNYHYIENSYSTYKSTHLTLASIINLTYPANEKTTNYQNANLYFPNILHSQKNNLLEILTDLNYNFYWAGNYIMPCQESKYYKNLICISNKYARFNSLFLKGIYEGTPIEKLAQRFIEIIERKNLSGQRNINLLTNFLKSHDYQKKSFFFIHQLSPHAPYSVNEECQEVKENFFDNEIDAYGHSYRCVLKEIKKFINFIDSVDPNGIIIIQGDHGINSLVQSSDKEKKINYKASIFNLIQSPEICNDNLITPNTNINSIRWAINCISTSKLKPYPKIHYHYEDDDEFISKKIFQ